MIRYGNDEMHGAIMFFFLLEILGTMVFAMSGALLACRKGYDLTAVMVIAFAVGNGGGTLRDIIIGATPVFWIQEPIYIASAVIPAILVFLLTTHVDVKHQSFLVMDAIGLGIFAIAGAEKALHLGLPPIVAVIMGVLTATGGGVIRDILCHDEPVIFKPEIYASAVLAGTLIFVPLYLYVPNPDIAATACVLSVIFIRLGTMRWGWQIPTYQSRKRWWF